MGRINWGRVFVDGLVADLMINLFEYVTNGVVLAANWDAPMKALGRHLPASAIPVFIVGGFITGSRLAVCSCSPTIRRRPQDRGIDRLHLLDNGIRTAYSRPDSSGIIPEATVGLWPALSALGFTGNDPAPPALSSSRCAHLNLCCRRARFAFVPLRPVVLDLGV